MRRRRTFARLLLSWGRVEAAYAAGEGDPRSLDQAAPSFPLLQRPDIHQLPLESQHNIHAPLVLLVARTIELVRVRLSGFDGRLPGPHATVLADTPQVRQVRGTFAREVIKGQSRVPSTLFWRLPQS